jgi:hypothetical protein
MDEELKCIWNEYFMVQSVSEFVSRGLGKARNILVMTSNVTVPLAENTTEEPYRICVGFRHWESAHCPQKGPQSHNNNTILINKKQTPRSFSPQANLTDWATATGRLISVPTFVVRGVLCGQRGGAPVVVDISFLDRGRYFFYQVSPYLSPQVLSEPRSRPIATQKVW